VLAPPGIYTLKVMAGGQQLTQPLKVLKDPHSAGTEEDIREQFAFVQSIRENLQGVGQMVNRLEIVRRQLLDLAGSQPLLRNQANMLEQSLLHFEENLVQLKVSGGQDGMRWPARLTAKLSHLATEVQESDFAPTAQQNAVNQQFTAQIRELRTGFDELMNKGVVPFNGVLKENGLPEIPIVVKPAGPAQQ
jgi:hypothetical protein